MTDSPTSRRPATRSSRSRGWSSASATWSPSTVSTSRVERGTVFGLLGPNGAGKTTAVRILTTILSLDAGSARVLGIDVDQDPQAVRERIGLAGQYAAVDENLTGRENLRMVGQLTHLPKVDLRRGPTSCSSAFGLTDAGRPSGPHLLRRHASPARPRRRPRAPPTGAVPRRAHHRPRPGQPQRPVGGHPGAGGRRHDRAAHHPVPGGGRPAGRPHRRDRRRPQDRRGHVGRAEGHDGRHHRRDRRWPTRRQAAAAQGLLAPVGTVEVDATATRSRSTSATGPGACSTWPASSSRPSSCPTRSPSASPRSTTCSSASPATRDRRPTDLRRRRPDDRRPSTRRGGAAMTATQLTLADVAAGRRARRAPQPVRVGGARLAARSPGAT